MARTQDLRVHHHYTITCDQVILDKEDRPTIVGAVRNFLFEQLPGVVPRLGIIVCFSAPEGQTYSVSIEDPRRAEIAHFGEHKVPPLGREARGDPQHMTIETRFVANVQNAAFQTEGIHSIVLRVGGRTVRRDPLGVAVLRQRPKEG